MSDKAIITSALPYANGEIHLGHVASTYLPADVTTRFLKLKGVEAYYICATDDYGTPILIQSEKEGKSTSEYVAFWNKRDYEDFTAFGIDFDFFIRLALLKTLNLFKMFLINSMLLDTSTKKRLYNFTAITTRNSFPIDMSKAFVLTAKQKTNTLIFVKVVAEFQRRSPTQSALSAANLQLRKKQIITFSD